MVLLIGHVVARCHRRKRALQSRYSWSAARKRAHVPGCGHQLCLLCVCIGGSRTCTARPGSAPAPAARFIRPSRSLCMLFHTHPSRLRGGGVVPVAVCRHVTNILACCNSQVPNGELDAKQLRFLGDAIAPFGDAGCGDITTRANVQLRGLTLAEADEIFAGLQRVGLSSVQTGA